ncbi:MAG: hypothetical protein KKG59_07005 [Nanoarchaeota archaeon]|nr:hypothetical protein [Nanoarchaeota archaeon]
MVNINISIPDDLHKRLRVESAISGQSQKDILISLLTDYINSDAGKRKN